MVPTKVEGHCDNAYQSCARSGAQANWRLQLVQFIESPWMTTVAAAIIVVFMGLFFGFMSTLDKSGNEAKISLKQNTYTELVDWHTSGPFMFKCAVAWFRVRNNNSLPIKELVFHYTAYDEDGIPVSQGNHTLNGEIAPGEMKNFFEQYLGFIDCTSTKLGVNLTNVKAK